MTAGISLILGKSGAHRAPLQLLDLSFSAIPLVRLDCMGHVNPAVAKLVFDQWQRLSARRCAQRRNQGKDQ